MTIKPRDPLLAAARFWLRLSTAVAMLFTAAFLFAVPALLIVHETVLRKLAEHHASPDLYPVILTVVALLSLVSLLSYFFLRHMDRIVGTVAEGDPFVPVNASRLQAMGWLTLAINTVFVVVKVVVNLGPRAQQRPDGDFTFTLGGILLALVLFVLARVFREGTRMRDELEGTV
jgi:hypothetical protein